MLCQLFAHPKNPAKKEEISEVIYKINCEVISKDSGCRSTYIGETGRTLKARFREHQWPIASTRTSEVSQHLYLQGRQKHQVSLVSIRIMDRDADEDMRGIRESVQIVHIHAPLRPEQRQWLPLALPCLGQHPPGLL